MDKNVERYVTQLLHRLELQGKDDKDTQLTMPVFQDVYFVATDETKTWQLSTSTGCSQFRSIKKGSRLKFFPSPTAAREDLQPLFSSLMVTEKINDSSLIVCNTKNLPELNDISGPWCIMEWVEDGDIAALKSAAEDFVQEAIMTVNFNSMD